MIVFLFNIYLAILFCLVWLRIVPFNLFWKLSPIVVLLLLLVGLFIPMQWGAPSGPALVVRQSVQIVPDVSGQVVDVPVQPNVPLKANDVLFRIDPIPYQAQVDALEAQLKFAELRYGQMSELASKQAGRVFDVEQRDAEVKQLRAQLAGAKWNLEKTVVRAPSDGFVTNLALRKGARVASLPLSPVMAFIETAETIVGVEVAQINARYIEPGQAAEIAFKFLPGRVFPGKVEAILQAVSGGQAQPSGQAVTAKGVHAEPFVVRIKLDDADLLRRLPAGSTGEAAIFTEHVKVAHIVRRVMLRMTAILNYINPF